MQPIKGNLANFAGKLTGKLLCLSFFSTKLQSGNSGNLDSLSPNFLNFKKI